jgi:hypothetical protein
MAATVVVVAAAGGVVAQSTLAQLGLAETAARNFVLDEIKTPATRRSSAIAIAGTRAFLALPPSARAGAATGLFAWAKAYGNSSGFNASYASYRKDRTPSAKQYALTVEEAVKKDLDEQLAELDQMTAAAASLPPETRANFLASVQKSRAMLTDPGFVKQMRTQLAAERAQESGNDAALVVKVDEMTPSDPQRLFARRLREFLDVTADVNFSARTISLTGGADGIEFVDRADRRKHWMWQGAAIVGAEATSAARAAAQAWLKEIER